MKRFINPVPQFLKSNGDLCSAGKLYFLQEGTDILTSTKAIYLDAEGASQSINPVPLSNEGRMSNVFGEGKYRAKLYDSANVLQWTRDIDFDAESAQFEEWNSQVTYSEKAITQGSDEDYYISEVDNNKGNDPTVGASAQYWSKIALIEFFNADKPGGYADNAVVIDAGRLYASNTANNTNTPPHATWDDLSFNNTVIGDFTAGAIQLQNSSSANPLKMDWYQEGTFTPVINGSSVSGVGTYSVQDGQYTRIGNVVYFSVVLSWSAHTGTGNILIGGLPFASTAYPAPTPSISIGYSNVTATAGNQIGGRVYNSVQHVSVEQYNPAGAVFAAVPMDTSAGIWASGFYFV